MVVTGVFYLAKAQKGDRLQFVTLAAFFGGLTALLTLLIDRFFYGRYGLILGTADGWAGCLYLGVGCANGGVQACGTERGLIH